MGILFFRYKLILRLGLEVFSLVFLNGCNSNLREKTNKSNATHSDYNKVFIVITDSIDKNTPDYMANLKILMQKGFGREQIETVKSEIRIYWSTPFYSGCLTSDGNTVKFYNTFVETQKDSVFLYLRDSIVLHGVNKKFEKCHDLYNENIIMNSVSSYNHDLPSNTADGDNMFFIEFAGTRTKKSLLFRTPYQLAKRDIMAQRICDFLDCVKSAYNFEYFSDWPERKKGFLKK